MFVDWPQRRPLPSNKMSKQHVPPQEGDAGFGRDIDLEQARTHDRPAAADLDSNEDKATQRPTIDYAPDPDSDTES
jgi:hypothetical protein